MVGMWETKAPALDVRLTDGQAQRWNKKPVGIQHVKLSLVERKKNWIQILVNYSIRETFGHSWSQNLFEMIFWGCPVAFDCSCQVREMMDEDRGSSLKSLDTRVGVGNGSWVWRNMDFHSDIISLINWCSLYVVATYYKTHQCGRCAQAPRYPWNSEVEQG